MAKFEYMQRAFSSELKPRARLVLQVLVLHCNKEGECFPSIKAIAAKDHIIYIKFESNHNLCPYLFISKIFDIFAKYRTPLCLLVSSNLDVSVAIDDCTRLSNIISELRQYAHVLVEDRMTIVSVVGNMQWEYAGFEAKIMEALKDIPLRMISYGSSNNDVAFVIKNTDKKRALQALNDKLFQPEYAERN